MAATRKLFVSYRRASWSFTYWLVEELGRVLDTDIFVDYSGIDDSNFETSILSNLRESDAVLLIVSEHTFAPELIHKDTDWVRREIREAMTNKTLVVLACHNGLMPPADLPDDIQAVRKAQEIEFYPRYFKAGVVELTNFIERVTPIKRLPSAPSPVTPPPPNSTQSDKSLFDAATTLAEAGQYDSAVENLQTLRRKGYRPRFASLDELIEDIIRDRDTELRRWEAGEAYDEIAALIRVNLNLARSAWQQFTADYPDFTNDPASLSTKLSAAPPPVVQSPPAPIIQPGKRSADLMPAPFAWIDIPAGNVTLIPDEAYKKGATYKVEAFAIAKYPVTNAQYARFIAADGYNHKAWWTQDGWAQREEKKWTEPRYWTDTDWNGADHPVVGVSWYEAVAFCRWLSETSGDSVRLPTEHEWQRAAQGDDGREYPWGNEWDCTRCNNSVDPCDSKRTSPVTHYEGKAKGDSFFKVSDMAGNVWEWCQTGYNSGSVADNGTDMRVLRGGSWYVTNSDLFRAAFRGGYVPHNWVNLGGFRFARSP